MKPNETNLSGRAFGKRQILDRVQAVRIMEELGFEESDEPGIFEREVTRGAIAPCHRRFQVVDLDKLLSQPQAWSNFVRRHRARLAEAAGEGSVPPKPRDRWLE